MPVPSCPRELYEGVELGLWGVPAHFVYRGVRPAYGCFTRGPTLYGSKLLSRGQKTKNPVGTKCKIGLHVGTVTYGAVGGVFGVVWGDL